MVQSKKHFTILLGVAALTFNSFAAEFGAKATVGLAPIAGSADPNNGGFPPGVSILSKPNDLTKENATAEYLIEAQLNSGDATGFVQVSQKLPGGGYGVINGLSTEDCPARASHKQELTEHRVKTPKGLHAVRGSAKFAVFENEYEDNMPWGTFFDAVNNNPIGIHTGPLSSISHSCIRVPVECARKIYKLVNGDGNTTPDRPPFLPNDDHGAPNTVKNGVAEVLVKWI